MAATFGRADGLVLTGGSFEDSIGLLEEVREVNLGVPLLLGGGANQENVHQAMAVADGAIVSSSFKRQPGWGRGSLTADWEPERIIDFMQAVEEAKTQWHKK